MDEPTPTAQPDPVPPPSGGRASRSTKRVWAVAAVALILINVGFVAIRLRANHNDESSPPVTSRQTAVADLLGWLPATDRTRRAVAVWTADPGAGTPEAGKPDPDRALAVRLGLAPQPLTLGRSPEWRARFGYSAADVDGWAVAGRGGGIAVLTGRFDKAAIANALTGQGYLETVHRGAPVYTRPATVPPSAATAGDSATAATSVGMLGDRLITGETIEQVQAAIDAALRAAPSLADDRYIAPMLDTISPVSALMIIDEHDHAVECGGASPDPAGAAGGEGRFIAMAYGRSGEGGQRRTMVVTSFADEGAAAKALPLFQDGWLSGYASVGGSGAEIKTYGTVNSVSQTDRLLIAEMIDGRESGWTRAGVRFSTPVCQAAIDAFGPAAGGSPSPSTQNASPLARASASLPDANGDVIFRASDLAATGSVRRVTAPSGSSAGAGDVAAWIGALAPLPSFKTLPAAPDALALWPSLFALPLDALRAVAEVEDVKTAATVGVLVGTWDPAAVKNALLGAGYATIAIDGVDHFALRPGATAADSPPLRAGGEMWRNVAVDGDRIFVSDAQGALRETMAIVVAGAPASGFAIAARDRLLAATPGATSVVVADSGALRSACGTTPASWEAVAAAWTAAAAGNDVAELVVLPPQGADFTAAAVRLDSQTRRLLLANPPAVAATPAPDATASPAAGPLSAGLRYLGVERQDATPAGGRPVVVAHLYADPPGDASRVGFFDASAEGCALFMSV